MNVLTAVSMPVSTEPASTCTDHILVSVIKDGQALAAVKVRPYTYYGLNIFQICSKGTPLSECV